MSKLTTCSTCQRHHFAHERRCPHCRASPGQVASAVALMALLGTGANSADTGGPQPAYGVVDMPVPSEPAPDPTPPDTIEQPDDPNDPDKPDPVETEPPTPPGPEPVPDPAKPTEPATPTEPDPTAPDASE